jgi:ADP-heptose:LPS heptosyltransferase
LRESHPSVKETLERRPVRRILAICREHVGDLVNTTPYLLALQKQFPEAELTVDVGESAAPVLENFPGLVQVWLRPTHEGLAGKLRYVSKLRRGQFDLAVILDDSSRFVLEACLAGIPLRFGVFRKRFRRLFTGFSEYSRERHDLFDPFDDLLRAMGVPVDDRCPRLFPDQADAAHVDELLGKGEWIGLNPAVERPYKRWPEERWPALADLLAAEGRRCLLLGPPSCKEANARLGRLCRSEPLDGTSAFYLVQLYEACGRLKGLVSVDTGTVHVAAAAGTPSVILYGPTDPKRFHPFGERWTALRAEDRKMESLTVEEVAGAVLRSLADRK